jgi:hypothetical protein
MIASKPRRSHRRAASGRTRAVDRFRDRRKNACVNDGRELDPRRPEVIVYWYDPPRPLLLVAFIYRAREGHEPRHGGSTPPWHSHWDGRSVAMHTWFTSKVSVSAARELIAA